MDRLSHELESRDDCVYGSVTAGNNVYGSEVVQNVLSALAVDAKMGPKGVFSDTEGDQRIPRIVLVPYDSRTNAEHGKSYLSICGVRYVTVVCPKYISADQES